MSNSIVSRIVTEYYGEFDMVFDRKSVKGDVSKNMQVVVTLCSGPGCGSVSRMRLNLCPEPASPGGLRNASKPTQKLANHEYRFHSF